ncbi:MAG: carbohydrate kinase family protein [Candidatus Eremiobacteraeota bacterium]|nr:carbohydrate kinase family protein [Candidatus Eremiobacteraeota bacterium]
MADEKVVVLGASNVDIKGRSISAVYTRLKNPGRVEITAGGVGRNIAENLSRLGIHTILLSAIGKEGLSEMILRVSQEAGVDTSRILVSEELHSGIFMAVINSRGELESSISDMTILTEITPSYVMAHKEVFDEASYMVIDADVPENTLSLCLKMAKEKGIPACVEPVSPAKAQVMVPYLNEMTLITPNREEVEVLVGRQIINEDDIKRAGDELVGRGVHFVIITLGPEGVYCASRDFSDFVSSISTVVVDSVGAGDALVAGVVTAFLNKYSFLDAVKFGIGAATLTLNTSCAVYPRLTVDAVKEVVNKARAGHQVK